MFSATVNSANEAYELVLNELKFFGKLVRENEKTYIEISPCIICNKNPLDNIITNTPRKWDEKKAKAEFDWYMSGSNKVADIAEVLPRWKEFSDDGVTVNSAYGHIWMPQLDFIIAKIRNNKYTRQAVLTLHNSKNFLNYSGKDCVCTLSIQFLFRNNALDMHVNMRSNDIVWGFCNDQYAFSNLQKYVCDKLHVSIGNYYHYAVSMHIYERHYKFIGKEA